MEMFKFETARFVVRAIVEPDDYIDCDPETALEIATGNFVAFNTIVTVETADGIELGRDVLCGSIYECNSARDFFTGHRDPNPLNRNCEAMRAMLGDRTVICHYFPDMVRTAIGNARASIENIVRRVA